MTLEFSELEARILSRSDREEGTGANVEEIGYAERRIGVLLTGGYRRFLERFGWLGAGSIEIYGVGVGVPKHMSLIDLTLSERTEMRPRLPSNLVPVMNDGAGNLYCIDTTLGANAPIRFWDHDLGADQAAEQVSPSFEDWLYGKLGAA